MKDLKEQILRLVAGGELGTGAAKNLLETMQASSAVSSGLGNRTTSHAIAVIGLAGRFPGGNTPEQFWELLASGRSGITLVPAERWPIERYYHPDPSVENTTPCRHGGFLTDVDRFDPLFFNLSGREARLMDPQQRLFLECAYTALEDAGQAPSALGRRRVGVYAGISAQDYTQLVRQAGLPASAAFFLGNAPSILAARVAYFLDLRGPCLTVDTACSSSLVALHLACRDLASGECELALAGGVNLLLTPLFHLLYGKSGMLSPSGTCRVFDEGADGFVPGEAVGVVALKTLARAVADEDRIHAVILGSGINQDGRSNGITAPNPAAQIELLEGVYRKLEVDPSTVSHLEAHGTGTKLGDPIEVQALQRAFRTFTPKKGFCALGSVKSNIGHTIAASGIAGLIKTLLAFQHQVLPPTVHLERPNTAIDFESGAFFPLTSARPWPAHPGALRRAALSSFGFSGTNCHMVLEEAPRQTSHSAVPDDGEMVPLLFSARSEEGLRQRLEHFADWLERRPTTVTLREVVRTLACGRDHFQKRAILLSSELGEALTLLRRTLAGVWTSRYQDNLGNIPTFVEGLTDTPWRESVLAYLRGNDLDWGTLLRPLGGRPLSLPTYPFKRERYWVSPEPSPPPRVEQVPPAELELAPEDPLVADHRVDGTPVLPAAGFLALVLETAGTTFPLELGEARFLSPLLCDRRQRITLTRDNDASGTIVSVRTGLDHAPTTHASVRLRAAGSVFPEGPIPILSTPEEGTELPIEQFYTALHSRGFVHRGVYRGLKSLYIRGEELVAELLKQEAIPEPSHVLNAAGVLDAAFQAALALVVAGRQDLAPVPYLLDRCTLHAPLIRAATVHVRRTSSAPEAGRVCFDLHLFESSGALVAKLEGLRFQTRLRPWNSTPDYLYDLRWSASPVQSRAPEGASLFLHYGERYPLLAEALREFHADRPIEELTDPLSPDDPHLEQTLRSALERVPAGGTVYLLPPPPRPPRLSSDLELQAERTALLGLQLAKVLVARSSERPLLLKVLTLELAVLDGRDQICDPGPATLCGLVKVLAQEQRAIRTILVDLASPELSKESPYREATLASVVAEQDPATERELAFRRGRRYVRRLEALTLAPAEYAPFRDRGCYLIVGGLGGLGLEVARHLARRYQAKLALVGRRPLDQRGRTELEELTTLGGQARYFPADVTNSTALARCREEVEAAFGPVHGVIHSALVLADATLFRQNKQRFLAALRPKVHGSVNLARTFAGAELDFLCFFSSAISVFGNAGQANYAAASTFQDYFAQFLRTNLGLPVKLLNWGFWGEVGSVARPEYRTALERQGILSIGVAEGLDLFEAFSGSSQWRIIPFKLSPVLRGQLGLSQEAQRVALPARFPTSAGFSEVPPPVPPPEALDLAPGMNMLQHLSLVYFLRAVGATTASPPPSPDKATEYATALGVIPALHGHVHAMLSHLHEARQGNRQDATTGGFFQTQSSVELSTLADRLRDRLSTEHPALAPFLPLLEAAATNYLSILRGELPATQVFFPEGSPHLVRPVYEGTPGADYHNALLASHLAAIIRVLLTRREEVLLLEVGAGTGSATRAVLASLGDLAPRVRYRYTDLSRVFLEHGRTLFTDNACKPEFRLLDLEKSLAAQGFRPGEHDLVVASNVLHATSSLRHTLEQVKALLAAGGVLLLNEVVASQAFATMTFGLLDGWWLFQDKELRLPGAPLTSCSGWRTLLAEAGFLATAVYGMPGTKGEDDFAQAVLVSVSDGSLPLSMVQEKEVSTRPAPEPCSPQPSTGRLQELRAMVAEHLALPPEELELDRPFSEFGVDSLVAVELVQRLRQRLHVDLTPTTLFDHPTLRRLASQLEHLSPVQAPVSPSAVARPGRLPSEGLESKGSAFTFLPFPKNEGDLAVLACSLGPDTDVLTREHALGEGVAFLSLDALAELIFEAGAGLFTPFEVSLRNVQIRTPVFCMIGLRTDLLLRFRAKVGGFGLTLGLLGPDGIEAPCLTCSLSYERPAVPATPPWATITACKDVHLDKHAFYGNLRGATFGPAYQVVHDFLLTNGSAIATLRHAPERAPERARYLVDPWALNGLLQIGQYLANLPIDPEQSLFVPVGARSLTIYGPLVSERYRGHVATISQQPTHSDLDLALYDEQDRPLVVLEGLRTSRTNLRTLLAGVPERMRPRPSAVERPASAVRFSTSGARPSDEPIAVIGMAATFPGSTTLEQLWANLAAGVDAVGPLPEHRWFESYPPAERKAALAALTCTEGGFLASVEHFDPLFFGLSGAEALYADPQQRLFLETAYHALEDAGMVGEGLHGSACGVFVGAGAGDYGEVLRRSREPLSPLLYTGNIASILSARLSYLFDLHGPCLPVDTACSSSLVALHLACSALRAGECDLALAGGVNVYSSPMFYLLASKAGMLSPSGRCRTFSRSADGFVPGEGAGVVVLKPLSAARRDKNPVYALILGSGVNHDGRTNGMTAPSSLAQERLERQVYERYSIDPATLGYVEAHGTGTRLGDPVEFEALTRAFRMASRRDFRCVLGSVKSNLGHLGAAAGIAGLIKTVLCLYHRTLVPSLHSEPLNDLLEFTGTPFHIGSEKAPWTIGREGIPRRAGVSAFGISGTNCHVVLEEAPEEPSRSKPAAGPWLLPLSAKTAPLLQEQVHTLRAWLQGPGATASLCDIAHTLTLGRRHHEVRLALLVQERADLIAELERPDLLGLARATRPGCNEDQPRSGEPIITSLPSKDRKAVLEDLAQAYARGETLPGDALAEADQGRTLHLPGYPFERMRYWPAPAASTSEPSAQTTSSESLALWRLDLEQREHLPGLQVLERPRFILLTSEEDRTSPLLQASAEVEFVVLVLGPDASRGRISLEDPLAAATAILARLDEEPDCCGLVDACDLSPDNSVSLRCRLELLRRLAGRDRTETFHLVHLSLTERDCSPLEGVYRVLGDEYRWLRPRNLQLERLDPGVPALLVREMVGGHQPDAVWRNGRRLEPRMALQAIPPRPREEARFDPEGLYLLAGGTGDIGFLLAERLFRRGVRHLLIVGSADLGEPGTWRDLAASLPAGDARQRSLRRLLALQGRFDSVTYYTGDAAGLLHLRSTRLRDLPLRGLIHCAGRIDLLHPGFANHSLGELEAVFEAKLGPLALFRALLEHEEPDFILLFTSLASYLPGLGSGFAAYAGANAHLDRWAQQGRGRRLALSWPAWRDTGMVKGMGEYLDRAGLPWVEPEGALDLLEAFLFSDLAGHFLVLPRTAPPPSLVRRKGSTRPRILPTEPTPEDRLYVETDRVALAAGEPEAGNFLTLCAFLRGPWTADTLRSAADGLARRHPLLQARLSGAGEGLRFVASTSPLPFRYLEVETISDTVGPLEHEFLTTPWSLDGPLCSLFALSSPSSTKLFLRWHHAVGDRVSLHLVFEDFLRLCRGEPPAPAPLLPRDPRLLFAGDLPAGPLHSGVRRPAALIGRLGASKGTVLRDLGPLPRSALVAPPGSSMTMRLAALLVDTLFSFSDQHGVPADFLRVHLPIDLRRYLGPGPALGNLISWTFLEATREDLTELDALPGRWDRQLRELLADRRNALAPLTEPYHLDASAERSAHLQALLAKNRFFYSLVLSSSFHDWHGSGRFSDLLCEAQPYLLPPPNLMVPHVAVVSGPEQVRIVVRFPGSRFHPFEADAVCNGLLRRLLQRRTPEKEEHTLPPPSGHPVGRPVPHPAAGRGTPPPSPPPGRTNLEEIRTFLRAFFAETLRIPKERIDPNRNFTEYGVDSVLLVDLAAKLEAKVGVLPATLFFDHASIEQLARYFVEHHATAFLREDRQPSVVPTPASLLPKGLLTLRKGGGEGTMAVLHTATGDVTWAIPLATRMPPGRTILALSPDLAGEPKPSSLEGFARAYLVRLKAEGPSRPLNLCGYSYGGLLALEMGRLAPTEGLEVEAVHLLDTYAPGSRMQQRIQALQADEAFFVLSIARNHAATWHLREEPSYAALQALPDSAARLAYLAAWCLGHGEPPYDLPRLLAYFERLVTITAAQVQALQRYAPAMFPATLDVRLIRCTRPADYAVPRPELAVLPSDLEALNGWDTFFNRPPTVFEIACSHLELILPAHAARVAELLTRD